MIHNIKKQKVVLFIPNSRWNNKRLWIAPPYAAMILTALLKDQFDFQIIDANGLDLSRKQCKTRLQKIDAKIVLISALSVEYHKQYHIVAELVKTVCHNTVVIMGGVYPTVLGDNALKDKNVDYIFLGHAEERIVGFLEAIMLNKKEKVKDFAGIGFKDEKGVVTIKPVKTYIADVTRQVKPDYSLIDLSPYLYPDINGYQFNASTAFASIITSYGCTYNCIFCATRTISGRKVVFRSPEDVIEEMEYLMHKYNVKTFIFLDDCILGDRRRIETLLTTFIEKKYNIFWKAATVSAWHLDDKLLELMRESGCIQVTISVESGSQRVLHNIIRKPLKLEIVPGIVKKCKELGIDIGANFVIGLPGETWDDLRETFCFAESCDFDVSHFHIATPLPKTDLYMIAKKNGYLPEDFSFIESKYFGFGQGFITTEEFTPFELSVLRAYEWDRINFNTPEKVKKVAKLYNMTFEELKEHRKQTRLKCGIHI